MPSRCGPLPVSQERSEGPKCSPSPAKCSKERRHGDVATGHRVTIARGVDRSHFEVGEGREEVVRRAPQL